MILALAGIFFIPLHNHYHNYNPSRMLAKKSRLTTNQFSLTFKNANRFRGGNFTFLVSRKNYPQARFAVVVGKKVSKLAVVRNRLRRQIYAQMQDLLVSEINDRNIICLYNGPEMLENATDFKDAAKFLISKLKQ